MQNDRTPNWHPFGYIVSALVGVALVLAAANLTQPAQPVPPAQPAVAPAATVAPPPRPPLASTPQAPALDGCHPADTVFANSVWRQLRNRGFVSVFDEIEAATADLTTGELGAFTSADLLEQLTRSARVLPCAEAQDARSLANRIQGFVDRVEVARMVPRRGR